VNRWTIHSLAAIAGLVCTSCGDVVARAVALPLQDAGVADSREGDHDAALEAGKEDSSAGDAAFPIDAQGCTPEVEPNDTPLEADPLQQGVTCGSIKSSSDTDWYAFSFTTAGTSSSLDFYAQSDALIVVHDPSNKEIGAAPSPAKFQLVSEVGPYQLFIFSPGGNVQDYLIDFTVE
jgi:hypothetical protein